MLPGLSQNSRRKNSQLLNLSTERTTKGQNKMDEKINLATLDIEYIKLIDRVLNATPEQLEKIEQLINE
jgi:hypothetical protein